SGVWVTRSLNTLVRNAGSIASLASNQITLPAGTYYLKWTAIAYTVNHHKTKVVNVTDGTDVAFGTSAYANASTNVSNNSEGSCVVTITASKAFSIQHRCDSGQPTNGLGVSNGLGTEVY